MRQTIVAIVLFTVTFVDVAAIQIWGNADDISTNVPADCRDALVYNITCANSIVTAQNAANGVAQVGVAANAYCTEECHESLQTFQKKINSGCGNKSYQLYQNSTFEQIPAVLAHGMTWAYDLTCIQDSSGFCLADLYNHTKAACSDCALKYGSVMMSSDYGRKKFPPAAYTSLLSSCSVPVSSYPCSYTPLPTTRTSASPTGSSSVTPTPTCSGTTYISRPKDTCKSISKAKSISTDRLVELNSLDYACLSLSPGSELCIQDTCTVYTVQQNQTCKDIIDGQPFGLVQLIGWNPTIHQNCDNLDSMVGRSICVSPPGGGDFSLPSGTNTTSTGLSSSLITSWVSGTPVTTMTNFSTSWYVPTIDPGYTPSVPTFTANSTLSSLLAERTKYCWITDEDENDGFDPEEMPEDCYSLYGKYCDLGPTDPIPSPSPATIPATCTPEREDSDQPSSSPIQPTPSSSAGATPTPTQPGMTDRCTKFHKVANGEECSELVDRYGVSLEDFLSWNPGAGDNCQSLEYGFYACVGKE